MTDAKCTRCLGSATGNTFEDARKKINHAVGLTRGIPCGNNYNRVVEIKQESQTSKPVDIPSDTTVDTPVIDTIEESKPKKQKDESKSRKNKK